MTKNKLIKNIDDKVWLKFAGHCKSEGIRVGDQLTNIISKYLEDQRNGE